MKKMIRLYRLINKNNSAAGLAEVLDKYGKMNQNTILAAIALIISIGLGFLGYKWGGLIEVLGGPVLMVTIMGLLAGMITLVLGFMSILNSLYMSTDIQILITLPFSAIQIATLRVLSFLKMAVIVTALCLIPIHIGYAIVAPVSLKAWIVVLADCLLIPVFIVAIIGTLVILLMTFLKLFRNKDIWRIIGVLLCFAATLAYLFATGNTSKLSAEVILKYSAQIAKYGKYIIPVVGFSIDFLIKNSILSVLFILLSEIAAVGIFYLIAKALYLDGALNMVNTSQNGKVLTDEDLDKYCEKKEVTSALARKEYRMVRRNPAYLLNNFIVGLLWPVLLLFILKSAIPVILSSTGKLRTSLKDDLYVAEMLISGIDSSLLLFFIGLIPMLYANIAYSSLTREGNSFIIMKQIPVSYKQQLEAKRLYAARMLHFTVTLYSGILSVIVCIFTKIPVYYALLTVIVAFSFTELSVVLDMLFGISCATVSWDDEKSVTKKGVLSALVLLLISALIAAATAGLCVLFTMYTNFPWLYPVSMAAFSALLYLIARLLRKSVYKNGEAKIRRLRF